MHKVALLFAATLISPALFAENAADKDWKQSQASVVAAVDVDAQGHIRHIEPVNKKLSADMQAIIQQAIGAWNFVPATVNGAPTAAHTYVTLTPEVRRNGKNFDFRLRYRSNGPALEARTVPNYPPFMLQQYVQARLVMLAKVKEDGSLSDIALESASTTNGVPARDFYNGALRVMAKWHARPETVDGHPVVTQVRMPISFSLNNASERALHSQLKISSDSPEATDVHMDEDESLVALDSPLKLRDAPP